MGIRMKYLAAAILPVCILAMGISGAGLVRGEETFPVYEDVATIFEDNCIMCHNGPKAPRGLRLTDYESVLAGGTDGPVVVPGDPARSEMVKRIRGVSQPRMPLNGPPYLDDAEIGRIERWIMGGAKRSSNDDGAKNEGVSSRENTGIRFRDIASILKLRCVKCHSQNGLQGRPPESLELDSYDKILDSRERARVIPGNPDGSELVRRIRGQALPRMPFDGPPFLSDEEILLIEAWVAQGAMDDGGRKAAIPVGARVRLHGRLAGFWILDDLQLELTERAGIEKRVSPGESVQVRGRVTPQGAISADRIRRR